MIEASFWGKRLQPKLVAACRQLGMHGHFERIENAVGTGTPDVDYCIDAVAGKLELKYTDHHPVRAATPVLGRDNGLRRSQIIWIAKRQQAGGRVFVAIGSPAATWVIDTVGMTPLGLKHLEMMSAETLAGASAWNSIEDHWRHLPRVLAR
jgi:hypothetical protein